MGIYAVYTYGLGIKNATVFDIMIVTLGVSHCKYTLIFHISIFVHGKKGFPWGSGNRRGCQSPTAGVQIQFDHITLAYSHPQSGLHGARRQGQPPPDRGVTVSSRSLLVCTKT